MNDQVIFRRGTPADSRPAFELGLDAVGELMARQNHPLTVDTDAFWSGLESYLGHLAAHAAEWWIAEDRTDGSLLGHARSVDRDGLFELSELFVRPGSQSASLGKALIERAFPLGRGEVRLILATNDVRALARYYAADTVAQFSMASLTAAPKLASADAAGDLETVRATADDTSVVAELEKAVSGFARHADYPWLFQEREAYWYRRNGRAVGFGFLSEAGVGPIAALEPEDQRFILLHLEQRAHERGFEEITGADDQRGGGASLARAGLQVRRAVQPLQVEPPVRSVRPVRRVLSADCALTRVRPFVAVVAWLGTLAL